MQDQRNVILAVVMSIVIILGFQLLYESPRREAAVQQRQNLVESIDSELISPGATSAPVALDRAVAVRQGPRVRINSDRVHGSITLTGARIDDVTLADYRQTTDSDSPEIVLLSPAGTPDAYFGEFGWAAPAGGPAVPGPDTVWRTQDDMLTPQSPVTLTWDNGGGLIFERTIALDEDYMFTVTDRVLNQTGAAVTLYPYGLVSRTGTPVTSGFFILHEGPLGVLDGTLFEESYSNVVDEGTISKRGTAGWIGITDKYWLAAVVPPQGTPVAMRFHHTIQNGAPRYQADWRGDGVTIEPGAMGESAGRLFAGAKEVHLLDRYADTLGVTNFDLAVDFGWFYFLTKPIFLALDWLGRTIGNFGVAILVLTVLIKLAFYPLANKSYVAMTKMKKLQPEMLKLRDRFKEDKLRQQQEMMAIYKREKVNPLAGCLPILVQIPVFFALYKVLFVTIEMRHAPFFGWIQDLAAPDPTSILNLFGLLPWESPAFLGFIAIGIWPILMGISMFIQQKLNPAPPDPIQARVFMILPIVFTFMLAHFPAGLVIYWTWNNLLSILQQWTIMRRMGVKA